MTAAIALPNPATSIPPSAQLTTPAADGERPGSAFAALLAALVRPSGMATEHECLGFPEGAHSASAMAASRLEARHELRAAEFLETGVFGLMRIGVVATGGEDSAALTQQIGPGLKSRVQRAQQQPHAPDLALSRTWLGTASNSAMAAQGVSPRKPLQAPRPADAHSDPQNVVADAAPATVRVQRQADTRSQARISFHCADQRPLSLASGQPSAVQVAITAAEHGLSVFARVGRMEPTERARLRHAAALLLAEHGHYDATVTLDADLAEAKGK